MRPEQIKSAHTACRSLVSKAAALRQKNATINVVRAHQCLMEAQESLESAYGGVAAALLMVPKKASKGELTGSRKGDVRQLIKDTFYASKFVERNTDTLKECYINHLEAIAYLSQELDTILNEPNKNL